MIIAKITVDNSATRSLYTWILASLNLDDGYILPKCCCLLQYWPDAGNDDGILVIDNFNPNNGQLLASTVSAPNQIGPFDANRIDLDDISMTASGNGDDAIWVQIVVA